jgi:hypothetical protein
VRHAVLPLVDIRSAMYAAIFGAANEVPLTEALPSMMSPPVSKRTPVTCVVGRSTPSAYTSTVEPRFEKSATGAVLDGLDHGLRSPSTVPSRAPTLSTDAKAAG